MKTRTREEAVRLWVAALRSGEYKQAKEQLRREDNGESSFCCLGVLCDLVAKDGGPQWNALGRNYLFDSEDIELPEVIAEFIRPPGMPGIILGTLLTGLALSNDKGTPFGVIADRIEKELL